MTTKTKQPLTYTNVGYRPTTGHRHTGKDSNHYGSAAGKRHALNVQNGVYVGLCGELVSPEYEDWYFENGGDPIRHHVHPAESTDGSEVTCARCRKLLGVQHWVVQYALYGRWFTTKGHDKHANKSEAEKAMAELRTTYPRCAFRVRMK